MFITSKCKTFKVTTKLKIYQNSVVYLSILTKWNITIKFYTFFSLNFAFIQLCVSNICIFIVVHGPHYTVKNNHVKTQWNVMAAVLLLYSLYLLLLVIDYSDQYKTIHCKSTNKNSVCNKLYHIYHNSLENLNQFNDKFTKTFYSVYRWRPPSLSELTQ